MREILFRGKRIDNGEWVEGYLVKKADPLLGVWSCFILVQEFDTSCIDGRQTILKSEMTWYKVDPETVGQYTGLRDCKRTKEYPEGQMIFEGDVIKVERDLHCGENKKEREIFNGVVWYDDKHTCFGIKSKKYRCLPIHRFKGDYSTSIGNIHDNPELLEEGGEE